MKDVKGNKELPDIHGVCSERVRKHDRLGKAVERFEITSWGVTLESTNNYKQAEKAYNQSSSSNKKMYKIDGAGMKQVIKRNYIY